MIEFNRDVHRVGPSVTDGGSAVLEHGNADVGLAGGSRPRRYVPTADVHANSNSGDPVRGTAPARDAMFHDGEWDAEQLLFLSMLARRRTNQISSAVPETSRGGLETGVYPSSELGAIDMSGSCMMGLNHPFGPPFGGNTDHYIPWKQYSKFRLKAIDFSCAFLLESARSTSL